MAGFTTESPAFSAVAPIHQLQARLDVPVTGHMAVGVDGSIFLRRSRYDVTGTGDTGIAVGRRTITQRNPEVRAYLAWHW